MLKKKFSLFAFFVLLVFALLTYQSVRSEGRFLDLPMYPLKMLERGSTTIINSVRNLIYTYIMVVGKEAENKKLIDRLNKAKHEKNMYAEIGLENQRLRKILKLKSERPDYVTSAEVFARDPTNWFQILWINKGIDDGIAKDMVAVTSLGPVGKIHKVFKEGANIILITDINSSVAVRLQSSRIEGILEGRGDNMCTLKYVSRESDVKVGERVVTSGLEGIYPAGLSIGYITDVKKEEEEMFQLIEVAPSQDLNTVEEVAILKR